MIETLTTSGQLYLINRHRDHYQRQLDQRRALRLIASLFAVVTIGILAYLLQ